MKLNRKIILTFIVLFVILIFVVSIKSKKYNIIYSYTCHEEPKTFEDTLNNLFYFNEPNIAVVIHCNEKMYKELPKVLEKNKNRDKIYINDIYYSKNTWNYTILKGHIDNFMFCKKNKYKSVFFIPIASNCMFKTNLYLKDLQKIIKTPYVHEYDTNHICLNSNKKINDRMYGIGVKKIIQALHEGMIIPYNIMDKITTFVIENDIEKLIETETVFEEFILSTLGSFYLGNDIQSICKVYLNDGETPSLDLVNNQSEPCFKRVSRNYDDPRRVALREKNNFYKL